jgi:hypothetical protein
MENIKFCGYEWITEERWGAVHPEKFYVWYDKTCVVQNNDNEVVLLSKYSPKYFEELDEESQMGIGLISCTHQFGYGKFDLEVKLPDLPYSWPAFWMWSWSDWPPEIDVFEGYSDANGKYNTSLWNRIIKGQRHRLETNVHIRNNGVKLDNALRIPNVITNNPITDFNKYSVVWLYDSIKFYINDTLIRVMDDELTLSKFENHKMNVIINNSLYNKHILHKIYEGTMTIRNFRYTELN